MARYVAARASASSSGQRYKQVNSAPTKHRVFAALFHALDAVRSSSLAFATARMALVSMSPRFGEAALTSPQREPSGIWKRVGNLADSEVCRDGQSRRQRHFHGWISGLDLRTA